MRFWTIICESISRKYWPHSKPACCQTPLAGHRRSSPQWQWPWRRRWSSPRWGWWLWYMGWLHRGEKGGLSRGSQCEKCNKIKMNPWGVYTSLDINLLLNTILRLRYIRATSQDFKAPMQWVLCSQMIISLSCWQLWSCSEIHYT